MKNILYVDCLIRGNDSNTKIIADEFLANLNPEYNVTHLELVKEDLKPLVGDFFNQRQVLLDKQEYNHPRFRYAHQLANADEVIIAAPFWDLSFPALLKIYIENCSLDGITFYADEKGLHGMCKGNNLVYITTRGGLYKDSSIPQDIPYLEAIQEFFGFKKFNYIVANGININQQVREESLKQAKLEASNLAKSF